MKVHWKEAVTSNDIKLRQLPKYVLTAQKLMQKKSSEVDLCQNIKEVLYSLSKNYSQVSFPLTPRRTSNWS